MDSELLDLIDSDPEVRKKGRSAFVRSAVELYLEAKRRRRIDADLSRAFAGESAAMLEEIEPLMEAQAWPDD